MVGRRVYIHIGWSWSSSSVVELVGGGYVMFLSILKSEGSSALACFYPLLLIHGQREWREIPGSLRLTLSHSTRSLRKVNFQLSLSSANQAHQFLKNFPSPTNHRVETVFFSETVSNQRSTKSRSTTLSLQKRTLLFPSVTGMENLYLHFVSLVRNGLVK